MASEPAPAVTATPIERMRLRIGVVLAVVGVIGVVALRTTGGPVAAWAISPPLVALALALVSSRPAFAMFCGALVGALVIDPSWSGVAQGIGKYGVGNLLDEWHLCAMGFALSLLGMVQLMTFSGGTSALLLRVAGRVGNARGAKLSTALSGLAVFFDDYANVLMVGPTLRPLTDRFGVSREKLAYLVDSTAAPVAGLSVLSTWVAYEVGLFEEVIRNLQLGTGGYSLLLSALPYRFYCLFALVLVFLTSVWQRDFFPMLRYEQAAAERAKTVAGAAAPRDGEEGQPDASGDWLNAALPLTVLLAAVPIGLLIDGGLPARLAAEPMAVFRAATYRQSLVASSNSIRVLLASGLLASCVAVLVPFARRRLHGGAWQWLGASKAFLAGAKAGLGPLTILLAAWALAAVCKDLGTGAYLVKLLGGGLEGWLVPVGSFCLAAVVAFFTGTSWGPMAILIPTVASVAHSSGGEGLLVLTLASVLDGAIFGDHCSPISDTTVMTCVATECTLSAHVKTQLPYALCAMLFAATAGYVQVAAGGKLWLAYLLGGVGLVLSVGVLARPIGASDRAAP